MRLVKSAAAIVVRLEETADDDGSYEYAAGRLAGMAEVAEALSGISAQRLIEKARAEARRLSSA